MKAFIRGCAWFVIITFPTGGFAIIVADALGLII